jgi:hypothetical protein
VLARKCSDVNETNDVSMRAPTWETVPVALRYPGVVAWVVTVSPPEVSQAATAVTVAGAGP